MPALALVRLKPLNPRRGYKLRRFTSIPLGKRYVGGKWYLIEDEHELEVLSSMCQNGRTLDENAEAGEESIPAFDVARSRDEAKAIERSYRKATRQQEPEGGTIDQPVRVHRPGRKAAKPRTRRRKAAEVEDAPQARPGRRAPEEPTQPQDDGPSTGDADIDNPTETIDELVERRLSEIEKMVDDNLATDLEKMADERGLSTVGNKSELAARIWDHDNGGSDVDEDDEE